MKKLKLFMAVCALLFGVVTVNAETDYTSLMSSDWTGSNGNFQGGKERYQGYNYDAGKIMYQSFTAPAAGIYEIKFYAVTSCTAERYSGSIYGDNIAQAYVTAGENKTTLAMTVINQTGCTLVADANIRTLSVEAAEGDVIEYGIENIATGGNWYTIKELSAKMKTVAEIYQAEYDEAYAIWENSTENEEGAKATYKEAVDAMQAALTGTLAEAQAASAALEAALAVYETKSYPIKGMGVKYDFTSKMNMAINAWTCKQGNGPAQYGFTGATETYGVNAAGEVMYQTISGLANGEYEIHFYAVANAANGGGTAGTGLAYAYANDETLDIDVIQQNECTPSDYERVFTVMVKDGTIKYGITNYAVAGNWYICKNVALYMTGAPDLSDYYDAIAEKLVTANSLTTEKMNAEVLSDLEDAISAADGYESITVTSTLENISDGLTAAITAAEASIENYASALALINAATTLDEAGQASYAGNSTVAAIQEAYNDGTLETVTSDQASACAEALQAAVRAQTTDGADMTLAIVNPSFDGNTTGWNLTSTVGGNVQMYGNSAVEYWSWTAGEGGFDYYQVITGLPVGKYTITADMFNDQVQKEGDVFAAAAGVYGTSGNTTVYGLVDVMGSTFNTYTTDEIEVVDGTLRLGVKNKTTAMPARWFVADNFHLTFVESIPLAEASDYAALDEAIASAEEKTLGFEDGEYAPYNNVEVLTALEDAKAINQEANNSKSFIDEVIASLGDDNWTANTGDVECVYNGNFALGQGSPAAEIQNYGWTRTNGWGQFQNGAEGDATNGTVYYNQPGSLQYGNAGLYTMPLKANMLYTLTFKYASWEAGSNDGVTASVLNGTDGMAAVDFEANETQYTEAGALVTKTIVFVTGEAGDYVLTLENHGNTAITGVSITKAASQVLEFVDGTVPSYAPGTYPTVKVTRTLTAGNWASAVYPFVLSGVDDIAVLNDYAEGTLSLETASANVANEPFLMRSTAGVTELTMTDVEVEAAVATDVVKGKVTMKGVYATTEVTAEENAKNYVLSNNQLWIVGANAATLNPYRAYFVLDATEAQAGARLNFVVDGVTTAIEGVNVENELNGRVYNLNGQRVEKAQKGLYIQNGKKVVLK